MVMSSNVFAYWLIILLGTVNFEILDEWFEILVE